MDIVPFKMEPTEECFDSAVVWICSNFYERRQKMNMKFNQSQIKAKWGMLQCDSTNQGILSR